MSDEEIEKIINKEFGSITNITYDELENMSYLEMLNKIENRIQEIKGNR